MLFIEDAFPLIIAVNARRFDEAEARAMANGYQRYFIRGERYAVLSLNPRDAEPTGAGARKLIADWVSRDDVQQCTRTLCVGAASVVEGPLARGALTALLWVWKPAMPIHPASSLEDGLDYCLGRLAAQAVALPRSTAAVRREVLERLRKVG